MFATCITKKEYETLTVGKRYWVQMLPTTNGEEYEMEVYEHYPNQGLLGRFPRNLFSIHPLLFSDLGETLSDFINSHKSTPVIDLLHHCTEPNLNTEATLIASNILQYLVDYGMITPYNLEQECLVNHIPPEKFIAEERGHLYQKYNGYYVYILPR